MLIQNIDPATDNVIIRCTSFYRIMLLALCAVEHTPMWCCSPAPTATLLLRYASSLSAKFQVQYGTDRNCMAQAHHHHHHRNKQERRTRASRRRPSTLYSKNNRRCVMITINDTRFAIRARNRTPRDTCWRLQHSRRVTKLRLKLNPR